MVGEDQTLTAMSIETYLEEAGFAVQTVASMAEFGWRPIQPGLGSPERVSPHVLRHAFATHMHSGGTDLRVLQELLGHAGIETTQIYTHLDTARLHHMIRDLHPLRGSR